MNEDSVERTNQATKHSSDSQYKQQTWAYASPTPVRYTELVLREIN